jgi:murein DD-endopeptidase MepM/ murein hydrolase activator NlpD
VRTVAIILATAIITAAVTSAIWISVYNQAQGNVPGPVTVVSAPAPPASKNPKPRPLKITLSTISPEKALQHVAVTARIGEIPDDLIAKQLTIPVPGVRAEELTPDFFDARGQRGHEALDIMAPRGQPVIAAEDGTIAKLFTSVRGGLTIYEFDPTEKYAYYYAHLDHYADGLAQGDKVTRGQIIGYIGSTGDADEAHPHLHFAIFLLGPEKQWWKGEALDPYPALVRQ